MTVDEFNRRVTECLVNAPSGRRTVAMDMLTSLIADAGRRGDQALLDMIATAKGTPAPPR
ncbi:MAG: hypothetical protein OXG44_06220 [Gammaproteobacteria bacterium]|nr:hypothetical protein [Gammaproteobacteria bacterium]